MSNLTHQDKIKLEKNDVIILLNGKRDNDESFFAYMKLDRDAAFKMAQDHKEGKQVDFSEYGDVILSGDGKPSEEDKKLMKNEYNFQE